MFDPIDHSRDQKIEVVLSAGNISHFHHIALALQQLGLLKRYYCTLSGLSPQAGWHNLLPLNWQKKLTAKVLPGLNHELIHEIPLPYLISQGFHRVGLLSSTKANFIFNVLYDRQVGIDLDECAIFHFVNSQGLTTAKRVKQKGGALICGVREVHIKTYEELLLDEYHSLGLPYESSMGLLQNRMLEELDIADYIFATTEYTAQTYVARGFPKEKVFVIPYGVAQRQEGYSDLEVDDKSRYSDANMFRILFVGHVNPHKGLQYLLKAFSLLKLPNSELVVVGGYEDNSWLGLDASNEHVRFIGHVPRVDLQSYYRCSSVFVLPSIVDSFGLVVSEAMAMGLPVIVSENVGAKEIVRNGKDGFVVPIRNVNALQEKILWLYEHPEERKFMGQQAMHHVREFTWDRYRERIQNAYLDIMRKENLIT